jgi:hypothetical protein|tara:strand:- start:170 stop:733 length:564 start_codon:yes stop_codon:yes gene_type:complete
MVAGFFVLDLEMKKNIHQIDYYLPKEKKVAAFTLDDKVILQLLEVMDASRIPEKLDAETEIDLDALEGILEDEMKNRGMSEDIKKIIAVLQVQGGKKVWNLNCVLSGMEILKAHVEDKSKTVLKMEKVSLGEIMQQVPGGAKAMAGSAGKEGQANEGDVKKELEKLNKLEEQIEKEKEKLKKSVKKK